MATSRTIFLSCAIFIQLFALTTAKPNYQFCYDTGNFTTNSTYQSNLNQVLSSISSDTEISNGFYNFSSGENPDTVYSIGLCRGDVKHEICRSCISNATQDIKNLCPIQKAAIVWYDNCMLRYSNRSIFGRMETGPYFWMYSMINVTERSEFNQAANSLLANLTSEAASGDSRLKFATGSTITASSQPIFGLVQCTPDLSMEDCSGCLTFIRNLLPQCCDGRQGGRVIGPSCHFRYEKEQFYDVIAADVPSPDSPPLSTLVSPPPPMNTATTKGKGSNVLITLITLVSVLSF
ncbi:cysteine-rich repeat secretory protein 38-like [Tripterygium wilfordii]|uniref:cysteine-rich repeat secretory protein 38-like n=1 Tax=Tripterygium wilfordii TaxID=458696 RepID=UPI0018F8318A|nr:cysteine-rich repeat secretory protein 38-like [Tripterygium wilfordii]